MALARDPLRSLLFRLYCNFYAVGFGLWVFVAIVSAISNLHEAYLALVPLSYAGTLAAYGVLQHLGHRREIETLQSYGVAIARFVTPLLLAVLFFQTVVSLALVALAADKAVAAGYAFASVLAPLAASYAMLRYAWTRGDASTSLACLYGCLIQTGFFALCWVVSFN